MLGHTVTDWSTVITHPNYVTVIFSGLHGEIGAVLVSPVKLIAVRACIGIGLFRDCH